MSLRSSASSKDNHPGTTFHSPRISLGKSYITPRPSLEFHPAKPASSPQSSRTRSQESDKTWTVSTPSETRPSTPPTAHAISWSKTSSSFDLTGSTTCTTPGFDFLKHKSLSTLLPELEGLEASKAVKTAPDGTTFAYRYPSSVYEVVELSETDDGDRLPAWKRRINRLMPVTTVLALISYTLYLCVRLIFTIHASITYPGATFAMAWLFAATEIIVIAPSLVHQFFQVVAWRGRRRPKLRLLGDTYAPTVDVVITCCKEEPDVILDTARACCNLDYPRDRFRVIVTDDGADENVKAGVKALQLTYPNIHYFARIKIVGQPHHAKAGNLVAATMFADNLEGGQAEFMACLDADMIPVSHWLRTVIAAHVQDLQLGLICPPQLFYNVPKDDPLTQRLDGWAHVMEPVKDAVGVAWCTGSGYAVRRKALDSIGGWPVGTLAEDTMTSSMLLGQGWKTAYVHEPLQCGTVPEDYASHLKQRTRWTLGTLQMAVQLNFGLGGEIVHRMTLYQRLSGLVITFDAISKPLLLVALLTIPIALCSGRKLVAYTSNEQLLISVGMNSLAVLLNIINDWVVGLPAGYRQTMRDIHAGMWMAPYHAYTVFRSFLLPKWLGGKSMVFEPTGSLPLEVCERDRARRAPLWRRLKFMLWDCKAWLHLAYIFFCITAIILSVYHAASQPDPSPKNVALHLFTHVLWPPVLLLRTTMSCTTPILYALFPPDMPSDREEYFTRDPKTGVATPKEEYRIQRWSWWNKIYEVLTLGLGAYSLVVFGLVYGWILR